jgi:hypothetical protein
LLLRDVEGRSQIQNLVNERFESSDGQTPDTAKVRGVAAEEDRWLFHRDTATLPQAEGAATPKLPVVIEFIGLMS